MPSEETKAVVLCADDYALAEGVSRGILELAQAGRISATSAMTNMPAWPRAAGPLRSLADRISVGLHLNLTAGAPLGAMPRLAPDGAFPPLRNLLRAAFGGGLSRAEIAGEMRRQLLAFEDAFGRAPDFIDGHQHVHVLPGLREALIEVVRDRGSASEVWVRDPSDRVAAILRRRIAAGKALAATVLAAGFRTASAKAGLRINDGFSGFSPFDPALPAERMFDRAFLHLGPRPLVMCHPGYGDEALRRLDPVVETRTDELTYLASDRFRDLLAERRLTLARQP